MELRQRCIRMSLALIAVNLPIEGLLKSLMIQAREIDRVESSVAGAKLRNHLAGGREIIFRRWSIGDQHDDLLRIAMPIHLVDRSRDSAAHILLPFITTRGVDRSEKALQLRRGQSER